MHLWGGGDHVAVRGKGTAGREIHRYKSHEWEVSWEREVEGRGQIWQGLTHQGQGVEQSGKTAPKYTKKY